MAFIPVVDGGRAVMLFQTVNFTWSIQQYYTKLDFDETDMEALASYLSDTFGPDLLLGMEGQTSLIQTTVYDMRAEVAPKVIDVPIVPPVGQRPGSPAAVHSAAVVTFNTNARGKTAQGRNYLSGLSETDVSDNSIGATIEGIFNAAYTTRLIDISPAGWDFVVASFQEGGVPRVTALTRPVTGAIIRSPRLGAQRRRVRRR